MAPAEAAVHCTPGTALQEQTAGTPGHCPSKPASKVGKVDQLQY